MKAEDTVMPYADVVKTVWHTKEYDMRGRTVSGGMIDTITKAQAEITWDKAFKAGQADGYHEGFPDGVKDGYKAGIKEVVEWIKDQPSVISGDRKYWEFSIRTLKWQAKLKEWKL